MLVKSDVMVQTLGFISDAPYFGEMYDHVLKIWFISDEMLVSNLVHQLSPFKS